MMLMMKFLMFMKEKILKVRVKINFSSEVRYIVLKFVRF